MAHQYTLILEMIEAANNRIAEIESQHQGNLKIFIEMGLPQTEINRIMDGLKEVSGLNAKYQEVANLKRELASL